MASDLELPDVEASGTTGVCPNCNLVLTPVGSQFCAQCGQSQRSFRLSAWQLLRDFIVETFELDGRLARTMAELFRRPGSLSQAFSNNQRASYVSPVRMYLFSSLLFFFLLALAGGDNLLELDIDDTLTIEFGSDSTGEAAEATVSASSAVVESPKRNTATTEKAVSPVIVAANQKRTNPEGLLPFLSSSEQVDLLALLAEPYRDVNHAVLGVLAEAFADATASGGEPSVWLRRSLNNVVALLSDPSGYYKAVVENLPVAMFVLLPFYALLLKLVFFSSRRYFSEHVVFALYMHIVAFLIFSVSIVLPTAKSGFWSVLEPILGFGAVGYLGVYTFLAMRRYYPVGAVVRAVRADTPAIESPEYPASIFSVSWRFLLLGGCYIALLLPALLLVMAFSFIGL